MPSPLAKNATLIGVAAAFACFLYICLLWALGVHAFGQYKFALFGIYAVFFVWAMRRFRVRLNHDRMTSVQGLSTGLLLNLVATLVYGLLLLGLLSTAGSGLIAQHEEALKQVQLRNIAYMKGQMEEAKRLEDQEAYDNLAEQLQSMEAIYENFVNSELSAFDLALDQASGLFMLGIFLTFLFMLILRSKSEAQQPSPPKMRKR